MRTTSDHGHESSLTLLEGTPVVDAGGQMRGRVADVVVGTGQDAGRVLSLVVKSARGREHIDVQALSLTEAGGLVMAAGTEPMPASQNENALLLRQDLLDRQIIDVYGRKVVRVNDVDLRWQSVERGTPLQVTQVEVGLRGATRRMLKGLLPAARVAAIASRVPAKVIPWEFVDVIEVDPARRVQLKIEHERLAQMHPADIADILEELAPAEREAVFQTLDEEVAAEALEEVEPKLQRALDGLARLRGRGGHRRRDGSRRGGRPAGRPAGGAFRRDSRQHGAGGAAGGRGAAGVPRRLCRGLHDDGLRRGIA